MKALLRHLTVPLLGRIEVYRILRKDAADDGREGAPQADVRVRPLASGDVERAPNPSIRDRQWYEGEQSRGFGWFDGQNLVAVCYFWWGARYETRNFWPLTDGQAKLVEIVTADSHRGRGIARSLIMHASRQMFDGGFRTLYARVWHSNQPSLAAFRAAGWRRVATVVVCQPPWWPRPLRWCLGQAPESDRPAR